MAPVPTRKSEIALKLDFAASECSALYRALSDSGAQSTPLPQFVALKAENILQNTTECFDFLSRDLIEAFLIPVAKEKTRKGYASGEIKTYFPFYRPQLTNPKSVFYELKKINADVYNNLIGFVDALENPARHPGLRYAWGKLRLVREMVNDKKHNRVIQLVPEADGALHVRGESFQLTFPRDGSNRPVDDVEVVVDGSPVRLQSVPVFKFSNGESVDRLCDYAVGATRVAMDNFYDPLFSRTERRVMPEPAGPVTITAIESAPPGIPVIRFPSLTR